MSTKRSSRSFRHGLSLSHLHWWLWCEALKRNGRYFWAKYDVTGYKLTPNQGTRPNGFKWSQCAPLVRTFYVRVPSILEHTAFHFCLGKKGCPISGHCCSFFMVVAITFAISAVILDPHCEGAQLTVKVTRSSITPADWPESDLYVMVVRLRSQRS